MFSCNCIHTLSYWNRVRPNWEPNLAAKYDVIFEGELYKVGLPLLADGL
jgi:hypothetical protein